MHYIPLFLLVSKYRSFNLLYFPLTADTETWEIYTGLCSSQNRAWKADSLLGTG